MDAKEAASKRNSFNAELSFVVYKQRFLVLAALSLNYAMVSFFLQSGVCVYLDYGFIPATLWDYHHFAMLQLN